MKKLGLFVLSVLFINEVAKGQEAGYSPQTGIRGAYMGSIVYPGFKVGVERPYKFTQRDKLTSKKIKTYYKERYLSYSLGMYTQARYHTNFLLQAEWIKRRQKSKGFYYEGSLGTGFSRTFVAGQSFEVLENGDIKKVSLSGNCYAQFNLGGSVGYNFNLKQQKPFSVYLKHHWHFLFPYNAFITPRPTLELGCNYNLSGFWQANPKYKFKEKQSRKYKKLNS
jgi:hypothetical protein